MKTVYCVKLKKELEGLEFAPYPGKIGERVLENISAEAWQMWLSHQVMLINEKGLSLVDVGAQNYLLGEMEKFLFDAGDLDEISGYIPE